MQYLYFADELSQIVTTMLNILVFVPTQLVHRVDFVFLHRLGSLPRVCRHRISSLPIQINNNVLPNIYVIMLQIPYVVL